MSGRDFFRAVFECPRSETSEFDCSVTEDVRVWRYAAGVTLYHVAYNSLLVFFRKIDLAKWNIQRCAHPHRIEPVFLPRAFDKLRLPDFDEDAGNTVASFL